MPATPDAWIAEVAAGLAAAVPDPDVDPEAWRAVAADMLEDPRYRGLEPAAAVAEFVRREVE
ncbi:hypothetical protein ABXN37_05780 [Piscinibacter sakaiensis]|nr:hypothetical protein [Piscinibacter sakaiensis]